MTGYNAKSVVALLVVHIIARGCFFRILGTGICCRTTYMNIPIGKYQSDSCSRLKTSLSRKDKTIPYRRYIFRRKACNLNCRPCKPKLKSRYTPSDRRCSLNRCHNIRFCRHNKNSCLYNSDGIRSRSRPARGRIAGAFYSAVTLRVFYRYSAVAKTELEK